MAARSGFPCRGAINRLSSPCTLARYASVRSFPTQCGLLADRPAVVTAWGILGQEFLSGFDYLLDFASRRLVFGAAEPDGVRRS